MTAKQLTTIEVPTRDIEAVNPYDRMAELAMQSEKGMEKLEKIFELREMYERSEAKKAYHVAMAEFGKQSLEIVKDKKGHNSSYASLSHIIDIVKPVLGEYGLTLTWKTEQDKQTKDITVTAILTHVMGYSESTSLTYGPETSGNKNGIQAIGSTTSYLKRYTASAILGIAEKDMDDDGHRADPPKRSMAWNSKEGKDLDKLKEIRPDVYNAMVSTHGNVEPNNLDEIKIGLAWCNQKIDNENKE